MMSQATLATELLNLTPTATEAGAVAALTDAYGVYAAEATANGVPLSAAGVDLGKAAMATALVGMSDPDAGLTKIPAAVAAFWSAVATGGPTSFAGATAVTPPPHTTLPADFEALMTSNTAASVTSQEAADSLAEILHTGATVGGTVTFPGPVVSSII